METIYWSPSSFWKNMGFLSTNLKLARSLAFKMEQTAFSFQANYFTKLIEVEIGKYGNLSNPK
jgi:hypothetical protein